MTLNFITPSPGQTLGQSDPGSKISMLDAQNIISSEENLERSKRVLFDAWLLQLETNAMNEVVETNTVKQLKKLYRENNYDKVQKLMAALRSKWHV